MKIFQSFPATEWQPKVAHGETVGFNPKTNKAPNGAKEIVHRLVFCRPCRGLVRLVLLPTVSPWAIFFRASGAVATQFAVAAIILFFAVGAMAQTTNVLSDAEIQGRQLAQQLCEMRPAENSTNMGVLEIRDSNNKTVEIPIGFRTVITKTNWQCVYNIHKLFGSKKNHPGWTSLVVTHYGGNPNRYQFYELPAEIAELEKPDYGAKILAGDQTAISFAGSDFWICDLGLEFLHWPEQKILPNPTSLCRGRAYKLLESTNPNPPANGYSRVDSWIDLETGGILQAEAYDANGKLLKIFEPKSFKKVNGQWELQGMEIRNVQTGSRTRIDFDLQTK